MNTSELEQSTSYKGENLGFPFEIVRWGLERGQFRPMNDGRGCWNYYVYVMESRTTNFNDLWLQGELKEFSVSGTQYMSYDHYDHALDRDCDWHGGVTLWEQNDQCPRQRRIKIGCDYSHLFDVERGTGYTLDEVLRDCLHTIDCVSKIVQLKPRRP